MLNQLTFEYHRLRRDLGNFSLLRHRAYQGFIISMHQSGTHWLKFMLALAIARDYGLPPPQYNHANDIIGGPRDPIRYPQAPRLASSHSIPHPLVGARWLHRVLNLPPYVILIRDIRASLVSNYEKWKRAYGAGFSEYLRGDPAGRRYNHDIWWCMRFLNAWGEIAGRFPRDTLIVRYEDLQQDAPRELLRISEFLRLSLSTQSMLDAVADATKERMLQKHDPRRPHGAFRDDPRAFHTWFSAEDREFFLDTLRHYLRHDFGYDYSF
jgi:hypothetical protein